jgi:hypothetical protein
MLGFLFVVILKVYQRGKKKAKIPVDKNRSEVLSAAQTDLGGMLSTWNFKMSTWNFKTSTWIFTMIYFHIPFLSHTNVVRVSAGKGTDLREC